MDVQGNRVATTDDADIEILIKASEQLRDLVKDMETAEDEIKGYIVYTEESEADIAQKAEEAARLRELIRQN